MSTIAALIAAVSIAFALRQLQQRRVTEARLRAAHQELERLQEAFSRFAPPEVVDHVLEAGLSATADKREVTILFADLKGFTAMSEGMDPVELVKVMNGYFEAMTRAIVEHGGHVSKFIGDGILAVFGAFEPNPWQATDAAKAALGMRRRLAEYSAALVASGKAPLAIGIGIHRGQVVAGVAGSHRLREFTVFGESVNLASRVEALTRKHGVDILVTGAVQSALGPGFKLRAMPPEPLKGFSAPVATWALEGGE